MCFGSKWHSLFIKPISVIEGKDILLLLPKLVDLSYKLSEYYTKAYISKSQTASYNIVKLYLYVKMQVSWKKIEAFGKIHKTYVIV